MGRRGREEGGEGDPSCHSIYIQTKEHSGKGNNQNVPEQSDQESSLTFEICSN